MIQGDSVICKLIINTTIPKKDDDASSVEDEAAHQPYANLNSIFSSCY